METDEQKLAALEIVFDAQGGRGVELAEEIDALRAKLRASNERAQVAEVFGLTGGELEDTAWVPNIADLTYYPNERNPLPRSFTFTYWYQGVPDYVDEDLDTFPAGITYRTVCRNEMFGEVPERVTDDEGTWQVVARYSTSGERECPLAPGAVLNGPACVLCEESVGEPHGYVYIGDGWAEIVYRLQGHDDDRALADARERLAEAQSDLAGALDDDDREILSQQVARAEAEVTRLSD